MINPEQELYDEVFKQLDKRLGVDVYDFKPIDKVPFPFAELAETSEIPNDTKSGQLGMVALTIHNWGLHTDRRALSDLNSKVWAICQSVRETEHFKVGFEVNRGGISTIQDLSTNTPLYHGIVSVNYIIKGVKQ